MKKNKYFFIFLIFLMGLLIRISYIDKPEGLWNDEYMGWYIASEKDLLLFFQNMIRNCHTPFYYIYLKVWMLLFGDSDIILRLSSVLPSVLSIPIMYFAGKELKDDKTGYLAAFYTSISSFSIYFAQEVRLYSLLFLFSSLSILFAIKLLNKYKRRDLILYCISSMFIVITHTLGLIYVFILTTITLYYILSKFDEATRKKSIYNITIYIILPIIAIGILILPFLLNIVTYKSLSQFWSNFSFLKLYISFSDYYSPLQLNIINTYNTIQEYIYKDGILNITFLLYGIVPTVIAFISIFISFGKKNEKINCLLTTAVIFFIYIVLISKTGRMILLTKYTTEIYPALILLLVNGFMSIKNNIISRILITIFLSIHLIYIFTCNDAPQKLTRPEGNYAPVALLRYAGIRPSDYVIFTYYDENKLIKYLAKDEKYNIHSINKFNFNEYLYNDNDYINVINNGKYKYKEIFSELPNKNIINYTKNTFINNMKIGDKIAIISLNSVAYLDNNQILNIINDKDKYEITPYIFLVFSDIKNSLLDSFKDKYKLIANAEAGYWNIVVFEKIKD